MRILQHLYSSVFEYEYWIRIPQVWCLFNTDDSRYHLRWSGTRRQPRYVPTATPYMNSMKTCPSVTCYFMKISFSDTVRKWILKNMIRAGTDCTQMVLVNSHQRWKQTRFRVCFHLWYELTNTISAIGSRPNHIW